MGKSTKFEAMVKLGIANTRMRHFHDIWFRAQRFEFDGPTLRKAIDATFARRQTNLPPLPEALTDAFANEPTIRPNRCSGPRSCAATA